MTKLELIRPLHAPRRLLTAWVAAICLTAGCSRMVDSTRSIIERHNLALERLPDGQRSGYGPRGETVADDEGEVRLPDRVLDVQTARAIAVRGNPDVHAAHARLGAVRERITQARARYLPLVLFTHNSIRTFHTPASRNRLGTLLQPTQPVPADLDANSFALTALINAIRLPLFGFDQPKGNATSFSEHSTALTMNWTVFDGFVREAQLLAAKYLHRASTMALADVERLLIEAVDAAYYQVQLAAEQVRIARADARFSQEQLQETEKLFARDRATAADVNNFRVRFLAAEANVTAATGLRQTGRVVLAELMGLDDVMLPADLELSPLADETEAEMAVPDPRSWIERALINRPDISQVEEVLKNDREQIRAAKGSFSPTIAVSGSWGYDRSSNLRYTVQNQSSAAAFEFRWELFSGGSRLSRVREAQSRKAETAAALRRRRLAVQSEVRQAIIDIQETQEQIRLQRETLTTARENRRIVQAAYLAGKEPLSRLNETQRDFIESDANLARARIRLRLAWSDLHAAAATYRETIDQSPDQP